MAKITQEDIDNAETYGRTPEEMAELREQQELAPGTYDFQIAKAVVEVVSKDNKLKDAIQVNLHLKPLANNGAVAKRYGVVFQRITVPVARGAFNPQGVMFNMGVASMKWLSDATGLTQRELVESFKRMQAPAGILMKTIRGRYTVAPDKNDPTFIRKEVKPAKPTDKVNPLAADTAGQAAAGSTASAPATDDSTVPF